MKTTIVKPEVGKPKEIDWSKNQLVKSGYLIAITTGEHIDGYFSATILYDERWNDGWKPGEYRSDWSKSEFTLVSEPVTITFEP